ncbi:hypothetical protein [Clostridium sp.]|uniref:hypothetical protein n=1 Tax=Clostridium sp. TaxID=1506 RepID=UPI0026321740|nr:hypothetical protein [Clostridium sp.]
MEINKENKLGAGIITLSVLTIISVFITYFSNICLLIPSVQNNLKQKGIPIEKLGLNKSIIVIGLISATILLISVILILMKKALGIYLYYLLFLANLIYSTVLHGFNIKSLIISIIFPALFGYFLYKKKHLYGFESK